MPAVLPGSSTVLVTGVSGFTGIWIARALLEAGYNVHGTVRSASKAQYLKDLFKPHGDKFKSVIIEDTSKPRAFEAAVNDEITAVVHVAAVVHFASAEDKSTVLGPNTDSVLDLMQTILTHGPNVKRFVFMSSAQALLGKPLTHIYTEDDWNDGAVAEVEEKGSQASGQALYAASKVLSERAILSFTKQHEGKIGWDATSLLPVWIFGPIIHECKSLDNLNLSSKILNGFLTTELEATKLNDYASEYIDVRDVADAFVAALKTEEAGGERFILDAGSFTNQNLYDAVYSTDPTISGVPRGDPAAPKFNLPGPFCSPEKAKRVLKLKEFRSLGECAVDSLKSFRERGF
ncbi:hypothetical protein QCA50_011898 [Cerrena zonata]|uniref:NAD-dependent epimerase/dehydratase domain-containing protein n=1 Tax=Cerrena zonata TaxID=2478898 RepID=A0AAW0FVY3_9APHY